MVTASELEAGSLLAPADAKLAREGGSFAAVGNSECSSAFAQVHSAYLRIAKEGSPTTPKRGRIYSSPFSFFLFF